MNKNTKWRRSEALKNYHRWKAGKGPEAQCTTFLVPAMRAGGFSLVEQPIRIGFVKPPEKKRSAAPIPAGLIRLEEMRSTGRKQPQPA